MYKINKKTKLNKLSIAFSLSAAFLNSDVVLSAPVVSHALLLPQQIMQAESIQGHLSVSLLESRLPDIALKYQRKPSEIKDILLNDESVWLDKYGFIFFNEPISTRKQLASIIGPSAADNSLPEPIFPLSQTFKLHSNSGSKRIAYLDFDGHTLTGTAWNGPNDPIHTKAYSIDDDETFSERELRNIQEIWMQVSEDYAIFDVDVTTEKPDEELIKRTDASDEYYGTRALITENTFSQCNCAGQSYLGIYSAVGFTHDYYQPALIFSDNLEKGSPKLVAEAVSHEIGHTLNLSHDGLSTIGYYAGHGLGETSWAPIMGTGYYKTVTQWSKGEYTDANNIEDDIQVIQDNGLSIKSDDHDNTSSSATPLVMTAVDDNSNAISGNGLIERQNDADFFEIKSGVGNVLINIAPNSIYPNLDIDAALFDSDGVVVASSNPKDKLLAKISYYSSLGGTYYLKVSGSGVGDALAIGYSDYSSLGRYYISGVVTAQDEGEGSSSGKKGIGAYIALGLLFQANGEE